MTARRYATSRTSGRATRAEMEERRSRLKGIIEADGPMSVRQAYYRAVVAGLVPKNDNGYLKVQRAIQRMRGGGELSYESIVDSTRWIRKPTTWDSPAEALRRVAALYRRNLWSSSRYRVEVWVESESIAACVYEVTEQWDVALAPCRGQPSDTFAWQVAQSWKHDSREPVVIYVGDHDPAGLEIERSLRRKLEGHVGREVADWMRLGVTWDQVQDLDLPGTTPKKPYGYPLAVEAEAIPPQYLRRLLDLVIRTYVDSRELSILEAAETSEREQLAELVDAFGGGAP